METDIRQDQNYCSPKNSTSKFDLDSDFLFAKWVGKYDAIKDNILIHSKSVGAS